MGARGIWSIAAAAAFLLLTPAALAATGNKSPTACTGGWNFCANAFADDTSRASASINSFPGNWKNYNFNLANGDTVTKVVVRADFFASRTSGYIDVKVSGDGGASYGPVHTVGGNTAEQTFLIDVTNDLAWDAGKLSNANFVVNVTCRRIGGGGVTLTCYLDWIPVEVTFTPFDFSISANPASATVDQGQSAQTTVMVTLLSGNSQTVSLTQTGCPSSSTCTFNPSSGLPTYNSTFTVSTTSSTPAGTYPINITGTGGGKSHSTTYTLTVNAPCVRANPLVSISPSSQDGSAGQTLMYTTSVQNQDSSGCGSSIFDLTDSIPVNWTAVIAPDNLTISPGSFQTATFWVTSWSLASPGAYTVYNTATNRAVPAYSATNSSVYNVV